MISEEILLKNGFKEYSVPAYDNCDKFYQKKINDKTFLNVYYYDKFKEDGGLDYSYEFEVIEERERCWCSRRFYGIDKRMTLEDIQEELNWNNE